MDLSKYHISQATHKLQCRHQVCLHGFDYTMPCIVLGKTKSGRTKIVVFGERYWKYREHIKRIRYVRDFQILKAKQ